ncbi:uncharacterized protein MELLADRAFT_95478 [Melampsora larici-populina 98AG31]|uniref:CxC5 like cysteine cluster associated with KDZ domain-containing protein n=1 Tax=Melampsora larici-populina (strain 98AG31 / pathotype 3-4-7) TaxID=747676 RepID=F4S9H4_MELLP|nr:uncharacterized protein MELLADRAFT_95478 [Melampsora larici-populina 98AG31]EGF98731.1 hypothetical protein MELLADRAFT_95478 [Melampsora larici-populina 98AG31]
MTIHHQRDSTTELTSSFTALCQRTSASKMLLRDFTLHLITQSPHLSATLTVADFVRFTSLAAEVKHRAGASLRLTATRLPLSTFLDAALSVQFPKQLTGDLWRLLFPLLPMCRINTDTLIREFGTQEDLTPKLPEQFLRSPLSHCIVCTPNHSYPLHVHSCVNGYLHDLDGVHTVQTIVLNCSNPKCTTVYRPSYYSQDGCWFYYTEAMGRDRDYLHINTHYYMSQRLSYTFRVLQMLGHQFHTGSIVYHVDVRRGVSERSDAPLINEACGSKRNPAGGQLQWHRQHSLRVCNQISPRPTAHRRLEVLRPLLLLLCPFLTRWRRPSLRGSILQVHTCCGHGWAHDWALAVQCIVRPTARAR